MIIRRSDPSELEKIIDFYQRCSYNGGALATDIILCAEEHGEIIGVVRYAIEHHFHMLRGMQVDERFHRHGIGKKLLNAFDELVGDKTCYCIPFRHLINFYAMIGFNQIETEHAPSHLIARLAQYKNDNLDMIIMKRK